MCDYDPNNKRFPHPITTRRTQHMTNSPAALDSASAYHLLRTTTVHNMRIRTFYVAGHSSESAVQGGAGILCG